VTRSISIWALGLLLFVSATNRFGPAPQPGAEPADAYAYLRMAESAPGLPADGDFALHHLQRIALPYAIGLLGHAVPLPLHTLFQTAALLLALAILVVASRTLDRLNVGGGAAVAALALLALNPWAFRFPLRFPEMLPDLGFVLGLAVLLHGLAARQPAGVLAGQLVASISRQTGLALIPVVALWVWRDAAWRDMPPARRAQLAGAAAGLAAGTYAATAWLVAGATAVDENTAHIFGLWQWLRDEPDVPVLAAFLLRAALPPLAGLAVLGTLRRPGAAWAPPVPALVAGFLCIAIQPLLGGPAVTGGNGPRLIALGLLPLSLAAGLALTRAGWPGGCRWALPALLTALAAGSIHHVYVLADAPSAADRLVFAAAYAIACGTVIYTTHRFSPRRHVVIHPSAAG
jgi:hypothetical protein